ncbi:MAG: N-acetylmuramoyl-L-alanine amidase [Cryomorphaceae bacterium]
MSIPSFLVAVLEANAALIVLYLFYVLALRKLTYYQASRVFLLSIYALSIAIAAVNIEIERQEILVSDSGIFSLSELFPNPYAGEDLSIIEDLEHGVATPNMTALGLSLVFWFLLIGSLLSLVISAFRWARFGAFLVRRRTWNTKHRVYVIDRFDVAFAFLDDVYIPTAYIDLPLGDLECIITHERAHTAQKHHWDRMALSFFKALFWYNPVFFLVDKALKAVHEFQVDQIVVASQADSFSYGSLLVRLQSSAHPPGMATLFSKQLIKSRVNRLHQTNSNTMKKVIFALALPLVAGLFYAFSIHTVILPAQLPTPHYEPDDLHEHGLPISVSAVTGFSPFGLRKNPIANATDRAQMHRGIDLVAPAGTEIIASMDGRVLNVQFSDQGYGKLIEISHANGFLTRYAHLSSIEVQAGQDVKRGEVIGMCGSTGLSTGPHLHFELLQEDSLLNPEDFMDLKAVSMAAVKIAPPLKKELKIIIDAGHGGDDPGHQVGDVAEKNITASVAEKLTKLLRAAGFDVVVTRDGDAFVPLAQRIDSINSNEKELLISLHLNAADKEDVRGLEMFIPNDSHPHHALSKQFGNHLGRVLNEEAVLNRGMKTADFYVLKNSARPSILVELGFMSSDKDLELLKTESYQNELADHLLKSISSYAR